MAVSPGVSRANKLCGQEGVGRISNVGIRVGSRERCVDGSRWAKVSVEGGRLDVRDGKECSVYKERSIAPSSVLTAS